MYERKLAEIKGLLLLAADVFYLHWITHMLLESSPVIQPTLQYEYDQVNSLSRFVPEQYT
jgi:hypothetical protein